MGADVFFDFGERSADETGLFAPVTSNINCEFKINSDVSHALHDHDGYEILLFLEGEADFYIGCNCYRLTGSELILINPGEYHRIVLLDDKTYKRVVVHSSVSVLKELSSGGTDLELCFKNAVGSAPKILQLNKQALQKYIYASKQLDFALKDNDIYGYDLLANAAIAQYFVQLNRIFLKTETKGPACTTPELMQSIIGYVDSNLAKDICLADMGKALSFNVIYMNRYFKGITGLTIGQYILSRKVSLAKKYLAENRSVSEVCELAGFNDCANFSRTFAKRVGCSPREFRKASIGNKLNENNNGRFVF